MTRDEFLTDSSERLNALHATAKTRYFWQGTRLFADGGSFGQGPDRRAGEPSREDP